MKIPFFEKVQLSKKNRKQHTFLLILVVSFLFLILTKLAKEYSSSVQFNVTYENLPKSKLFQNDPDALIALQLKTTGFKLLGANFNRRTIHVDLQNVVYKNGYHYYLLSRNIKEEIQSQLGNSIKLEFIKKDTLFFDLGLNATKKVPVILDMTLRYKLGYNLSEEVAIEPDSVEIKGPEVQIDKITSLKMETLELLDISENINQDVFLQLPKNLNKVTYETKKVKVLGVVEKFTEGSFEVPFSTIGLPDGVEITTYPKTVKVVFQVGISNYSKITKNSFKVQCDYSKSEGLNYLVPELLEKTELVSSVKLSPSHIEFLIKK